MRPSFVVLAALMMGVAAAPATRKAVAPLDLRAYRAVDLTHRVDDTTLNWPTAPLRFEIKTLHHGRTEAGYFYSAYWFCTPEHAGTHFDAPIHFAEGRHAAEEIALDRLMGPAVVIDIRAPVAAEPDYRLTVADVQTWEARHGAIPPGSIVLLRTGWSSRWPDAKRYFGDDTPGDASRLHFPSYGRDSAKLLVEGRRVSALGVDAASLDHGPSKDFIVHQIASDANVPGLENLTNLDQLPETGASIVALPMKIAGGSGGPVRAVALLP